MENSIRTQKSIVHEPSHIYKSESAITTKTDAIFASLFLFLLYICSNILKSQPLCHLFLQVHTEHFLFDRFYQVLPQSQTLKSLWVFVLCFYSEGEALHPLSDSAFTCDIGEPSLTWPTVPYFGEPVQSQQDVKCAFCRFCKLDCPSVDPLHTGDMA